MNQILDVGDLVEHCWLGGVYEILEAPHQDTGRLRMRFMGVSNFGTSKIEVHWSDVRLVGKGGVH